MKDFVVRHFDFKMYGVSWLALAAAIAIIPCVLFLPECYGFENGPIENLQLVVLVLAFIISLKTKHNKKFYNFVAMVIAILVIREVNCGRTIFYAIPGTANEFYTWDQIKYGWLYHPVYGLYIAFTAFYFLKNKLFFTVFSLLKDVKLPFWNLLLMFTGMFLGTYAENALGNMVFEESAELLFYIALTGIIYLYQNKK